MNILKHKPVVLDLLKNQEHLRDDDNRLIANVWHKHIVDIGLDPVNITAYDLLDMFAKSELPNPQSIRRIRRKLQEEFKELRGNEWDKRHKEQDNVKKQLKEPDLYTGGTP